MSDGCVGGAHKSMEHEAVPPPSRHRSKWSGTSSVSCRHIEGRDGSVGGAFRVAGCSVRYACTARVEG